jgi:hypothetical protein
MFILDSLMISGIRWVLETTVTAAEAEMNDDTVLREQLLEAEMRREMGEITDEQFRDAESDLLARIREIKERREGGAGPLAFASGEAMETSPDTAFHIEASVSGDFHGDGAAAPHTTVVDTRPPEGGLLQTDSERTIAVLDMEPGDPSPVQPTRARRKASPPRRPAAGPSRTRARRRQSR